MSNLFSRLSSAAQKRAEFRRTVAELETMDDKTVFDLGLYRFDFAAMAHKSVYGK